MLHMFQIDINYLPEHDQDGNTKLWQILCKKKYNFQISAFVSFIVWTAY